MGKDKPFGGKIFRSMGDFPQAAPSVCFASKTETINASIVSSPFCPSFSILHLYKLMHNAFGPKYARLVIDIG
jgi:hypothetical protein